MNMRMRLSIFVVFLTATFVVTTSSLYSAIKPRDAEMIKIAYMNGYHEALQLNSDALKDLKKDEVLMKQTIEKAADRYVGVINSMNK